MNLFIKRSIAIVSQHSALADENDVVTNTNKYAAFVGL